MIKTSSAPTSTSWSITSATSFFLIILLTPTQFSLSNGDSVGARRLGVITMASARSGRGMLYWQSTYLGPWWSSQYQTQMENNILWTGNDASDAFGYPFDQRCEMCMFRPSRLDQNGLCFKKCSDGVETSCMHGLPWFYNGGPSSDSVSRFASQVLRTYEVHYKRTKSLIEWNHY